MRGSRRLLRSHATSVRDLLALLSGRRSKRVRLLFGGVFVLYYVGTRLTSQWGSWGSSKTRVSYKSPFEGRRGYFDRDEKQCAVSNRDINTLQELCTCLVEREFGTGRRYQSPWR